MRQTENTRWPQNFGVNQLQEPNWDLPIIISRGKAQERAVCVTHTLTYTNRQTERENIVALGLRRQSCALGAAAFLAASILPLRSFAMGNIMGGKVSFQRERG